MLLGQGGEVAQEYITTWAMQNGLWTSESTTSITTQEREEDVYTVNRVGLLVKNKIWGRFAAHTESIPAKVKGNAARAKQIGS